MVGRRAVLSDRHLAERLALDEPARLTRRDVVARARAVLVHGARSGTVDAEFKSVTGRPVAVDLGFAGEFEARLLERVRADVGVALDAVIPREHSFVNPARN